MSLTKPTGAMLNAGSTSAPQALGTAAAGTSQSYSRADHVHAMPSAGDVGAIPTSQLASLASLTGGHLTTSQIPALGGDITLAAGAVSAQVVALQGSAVAATAPTSGQVLAWNGTQWAPATASTGGGGGANGLTYYLRQDIAADAPTTNLPGTPKQLGRTGSASATSLTSGTLTSGTWTLLGGYVSESTPIDPDVTQIPAGLWDFNLWALGTANTNSPTVIRAKVYVYNGADAPTLIGTSGEQIINNVSAQFSLSVLISQTTIALTDRIYIAIEVKASANNHTATLQFGDGQPSHVHTSLPLVGGTGLWKNSSGVLQSPASLLVDADVDAAAGIALSKIAGAASTAQVAAITPASIGAMATSERATYATTASVAAITAASLGALSTAQAVTLAQGGTGQTTQQAALNTLAGAVTANCVLKGNGTNVTLAALTSADIPTLNQNTTGTATNVTGVVAIANGGTGGTNGDDAINNLGFPAQIRPVVSNVNLGTGTTASYVFTSGTTTPSFVAHSILTAGDNILCSSASNSMNLGPWVVTTTGYQAVFVGTLASGSTSLNIVSVTSGTVAVGQTIVIPNSTNTITISNIGTFNGTSGTVTLSGSITTAQTSVTMASGTGVPPIYTRPAWFRGTLPASSYYFQITKSTSAASGQGNIYSIFPSTASDSIPSVTPNASTGTSWSNAIIAQRAANATTSSNTFSGKQTLWAGSTGGNIPLAFQAGAITTTPVAHSVEWDNAQMYVTNSASERLPVATSKAQINNQTGTTYSIVLADAGYLVTLSNASAISVTIPTDVSVAFPIGTQILLMQLLAGQVTVSAVTPGTTTVTGKNGLKTSGRYAVISLIKIASNSWIVAGDASA